MEKLRSEKKNVIPYKLLSHRVGNDKRQINLGN